MTYARLPVHQPTFIAVTAAGVLALAVAAALALLQPVQATPSTVADAGDDRRERYGRSIPEQRLGL